MGRFKCFKRGISNWLDYGVYLPHIYIDNEKWTPTIIAANADGFRIIDSLVYDVREDDEEIFLNAGYKECKCRDCGKKIIEWTRDIRNKLPVVKEDGSLIP